MTLFDLQDIYFLAVIALIRGSDSLFPAVLTRTIIRLLTWLALTFSHRKVRRVREHLAVSIGTPIERRPDRKNRLWDDVRVLARNVCVVGARG